MIAFPISQAYMIYTTNLSFNGVSEFERISTFHGNDSKGHRSTFYGNDCISYSEIQQS
jgi:hypothetical protein